MIRILFGAIVILNFFTICINADPIINDISLKPTNPLPKSTINFTANVTGDQINEVYLIVIECKPTFCLKKNNESMIKLESGMYQKSITLQGSDSTYIEYWLEINGSGTWYSFENELIKKNLSLKQDDSSPGFELLVFLVSIMILIFIIKKKRR